MAHWNPPSEPVDLREQPECLCPVDGPAAEGCPLCCFVAGVDAAIREEDRAMRRPLSGLERAERAIIGPDEPEEDITW